MKRAVLFDLGNTLVEYYDTGDFPYILRQCIHLTRKALQRMGVDLPPDREISERVAAENHEAEDFRVRPLEERLARIFGLKIEEEYLLTMLCTCFMKPIYLRGMVYSDTCATLARLRESGVKTAIVSNTPWGGSAELWRSELERLGLSSLVDTTVFCRDAGVRKPDPAMIRMALADLYCTPEDAVMVGDADPDIQSAAAAGVDFLLMDRRGLSDSSNLRRIHTLSQVVDFVRPYVSETADTA